MIMTAQEMLEQAIVELGNLHDGEVFIVKDLFKGHIWNAQDKSERLTLGTLFMNFVKQNLDKIEVLSKNSSGQQEYRLLNGWKFKPHSQKNCLIKTGVMEIKIVDKRMMFASIGTSGQDLCEMSLRSEADVEKLASILNQVLID